MYAVWRALLGHQLRLLKENSSACAVIFALAGTMLLLSLHPSSVRDNTCYVLYWEDDAWVRCLRESAALAAPLEIQVAHVSRFTNGAGLIAYPVGAHSIQLRPAERPGQGHVVWYWYSGPDPAALQPAVAWFWRVTREHFPGRVPAEVRVSALEPLMPIVQSARISTRKLLVGGVGEALTVWSAIFYCACYLPAVSLAHQREHGTLYSLVATPAGWRRPVLATAVFHGCLAAALASLGIACFSLGDNTWGTCGMIVVAIGLYLGVGVTLGCCCRSAMTASGAVMVYLLASGSLAGLSYVFPGLRPSTTGVEWNVLEMMLGRAETSPFAAVALAAWAAFWLLAAACAYFRFRCP
jgi:hypothetical protein